MILYEPQIWEGEVDDLPLVTGRQVIYRTFYNGVPVEVFAYLREGSKSLIVSGQDALNRNRQELPYFYRWSWYQDVPCSFVTINDPTLHRFQNLIGGWYQLGDDSFAIPIIAEIVRKIADLQAIEEDRMVLYGASAGGFWALMTGALFPSASVVVEVPQTNMFDYPAQHNSWALFRACYPGLKRSQIERLYRHKLRVTDYYKHVGQIPPKITYHQNVLDHSHIETQMKPFLSEMAELYGSGLAGKGGRVDLRFFERNTARGGHCPMDKPDSVQAMVEPIERASAMGVQRVSNINA